VSRAPAFEAKLLAATRKLTVPLELQCGRLQFWAADDITGRLWISLAYQHRGGGGDLVYRTSIDRDSSLDGLLVPVMQVLVWEMAQCHAERYSA
jgi:hypothetical protein